MTLVAKMIAKPKIIYPDFIKAISDNTSSIFYIISKEPGYYKFGITSSLRTRMKKHYSDFQFTHIDAIIDCKYDSVMRAVETEFKREAAKQGILITKYDKTEVVRVIDISPYITWVQERVCELLKLPQPQNTRAEYKKLAAEIKTLHALRANDAAEIAILREKIAMLESLLK